DVTSVTTGNRLQPALSGTHACAVCARVDAGTVAATRERQTVPPGAPVGRTVSVTLKVAPPPAATGRVARPYVLAPGAGRALGYWTIQFIPTVPLTGVYRTGVVLALCGTNARSAAHTTAATTKRPVARSSLAPPSGRGARRPNITEPPA